MQALHRSPKAAVDDGVSTFVKARSRMLAMASRTLGNAAEAEDIVQDVWLRWQNVDREEVRNAPAFLTTATVRLAINWATGGRQRHETALETPFIPTRCESPCAGFSPTQQPARMCYSRPDQKSPNKSGF